jgi:hypothetical protein
MDAGGEVGTRADVEQWLLMGDPSIRWQVMRDLTEASPAEVTRERARVAVEGWGGRLLDAQDPDGLWAGALYSPKWTSTTYTLLLLHRLGLPTPNTQATLGCMRLWGAATDHGGGLNLAKTVRQPETCITAMLVLLGSAYGAAEDRVEHSVVWLLQQQMDDGGWNCELLRSGARHGSFHTTISVLEALLEYRIGGGPVDTEAAEVAGRDLLLRHHLFRAHRTGEVIDSAFVKFPFPPQWHYDVLRALEHFYLASAPRDERLQDAVDLVVAARRADGRWPRHRSYPGRRWFEMEPPGPSRWTTLRGLRVLQWWAGEAGG